MNIADTLRQEIGRSDTLKQVADGAKIPYACVHGFVNGDADIQLSNVQKLADYFGYRLVKARPRRPKKRRPKV